jgi:hypothetical protein
MCNPNAVFTRTGWFPARGNIIMSIEDWETVYTWSGRLFETRNEAIAQGFTEFGVDDFNIGHLTNNTLDWWGWMDHEHPANDRVRVARNLGFRVEETQ